jgi:TonB family protein
MWFAMLADLAVKSTAVMGAAEIASLLMRRRSAAARHLMWTAAAAVVLFLPFLSVWLPGLPVRGANVILPSGGVVFQITATARAGTARAQASHPAGTDVPNQPAPWRPDWPLCMAIVWAGGSVVLGVQMLAAWIKISRVCRSSALWPDCECGVDVLRAPAGSMPMTYGIWRPVVLLPEDAAAWGGDLRRAVLLHEVAHVRRADVATQMLARLALTLHWWNPLAWMAWRQFLKEREHAADDLVLAAGERASDYAGHLLQIARSRQSVPQQAWAAVCMARRSQLEGRLAAILDARASRAAAGRKSALAAAVAAVIVAAPLAALRAERTAPRPFQPIVNFAVQSIAPETARPEREPAAAVTQEDMHNPSLVYGLGLLKIADLEKSRHRLSEAEAFYIKAAAVLGDRREAVPAWLYLGIHEKNPVAAIQILRKVERLDPSHAGPARMWMALTREREKDFEEAEKMYKSALAAEKPESPAAATTLQLYAGFLKKQGREDEAQAAGKQAENARRAATREGMMRIQAGRGPEVYRVGSGVSAPKLRSKIEPQYTEEARVAKFQGTVVIYAEIGADGLAHNLHVIRGLGLGLDEKALEAIDRWRFYPGSKDGTPVTVAATIEVNFRLL